MTENEKEIKVAIEHLKARNMSAKHIDMAIQALEKQIPNKPSLNNRKIQCVNGHNLPIQHYKYCPFCGQMIDWQ